MARGLKFWIYKVEESYYPWSENKGADQLPGHREADLRLCFRICKKPGFSYRGSNVQTAQKTRYRENNNRSTALERSVINYLGSETCFTAPTSPSGSTVDQII